MWFVKNKKKINKRRYLFLALVFFFTNFLTFKTLKKVEIHDIKIQGSKLFSKKDIVKTYNDAKLKELIDNGKS